MRMIIVGASGTIGSALRAAAMPLGKEVVGTCHSRTHEGLLRYDMREKRLGSVVGEIGPKDTVYLLSSYTDVSWIYANQEKARKLNVRATQRLIDEIAPSGARIIFMSSAEVFDGEGGGYNEKSLPKPLSAYGRMKFEIEEYLSKKKCNSCIVRTGWNVSWEYDHPCVVKMTYKALLSPGAKMAQDNVFSITDVRDTAQGLLKLGQRSDVSVCNLASSPAIARNELASMIMDLSKHKGSMSYETALFADIRYPEKRPRRTNLDNAFAALSLGMDFKPPGMLIRQKVELLDKLKLCPDI